MRVCNNFFALKLIFYPKIQTDTQADYFFRRVLLEYSESKI